LDNFRNNLQILESISARFCKPIDHLLLTFFRAKELNALLDIEPIAQGECNKAALFLTQPIHHNLSDVHTSVIHEV